MKTRVQDTRPVSHAHFDLSTAEIPKKMKIMVSAMLARVFIVYFTVVRDFWEMLASTYLLAPIPQKVILRTQKKNQFDLVRQLMDSRGSQQHTSSQPGSSTNRLTSHTDTLTPNNTTEVLRQVSNWQVKFYMK